MILTSQLDSADDRKAWEFLAKYGDTDRSGYWSNVIAGSEHVATSYLDVVRAGYTRMTPEARRDPTKRGARRELILDLIAAHLRNRETVRRFRF